MSDWFSFQPINDLTLLRHLKESSLSGFVGKANKRMSLSEAILCPGVNEHRRRSPN